MTANGRKWLLYLATVVGVVVWLYLALQLDIWFTKWKVSQ